MKKAITVIIMLILFIVIYILQSDFFSWFTIAGIMPNLFIILVIFVGLFAGTKVAFFYGAVIGLLLDLILGKVIGISSILYSLLGILGAYLDKTFSKDNRIMLMVIVIIATITYEIAVYIVNSILFKATIEIIPFTKIIVIETIYNTILTILLYGIIQKAGYRVEEIFKEQKILTRYF